MRDQLHPKNFSRQLLGFGGRLGELHSPTLAATARVDLRLDDDNLAAELLCNGFGLGRRLGQPAFGHRNTELAKQLLRLILMDVHDDSSLARAAPPRRGCDEPGTREPFVS